MVETKVKASSGAALAAGIADWLLGKYALKGMDPTIAAEIYAAVPAVLAFAAGWLAPHTHRSGCGPAFRPLPMPPTGAGPQPDVTLAEPTYPPPPDPPKATT